MKIMITHDDAELHLDTTAKPEVNLVELLDTFSERQIPHVINDCLRTLRGICDAWNERELAARRQADRLEDQRVNNGK